MQLVTIKSYEFTRVARITWHGRSSAASESIAHHSGDWVQEQFRQDDDAISIFTKGKQSTVSFTAAFVCLYCCMFYLECSNILFLEMYGCLLGLFPKIIGFRVFQDIDQNCN
jgi:hypothetical protein